jgi:hypothetical protein
MKTKFQILLLMTILSIPISLFAQYENKSDLYLNFTREVSHCQYNSIKFKVQKESGTQFNLCGKAVLLSPKDAVVRKLPLEDLCYLNVVDSGKIDALANKWKVENCEALEAYYDGPYPFYGKNQMFNTYVVEVEKELGYINVYPVIWPHGSNLAMK